ncbi:MAG: stage III sporulation protein AE [Bacillota bacterium]
MKKLVIITMIICLFSTPSYAFDEDAETQSISDELIMEQLQNIDTEELEEMMDEINADIEEYLPKMNMENIVFSLIKGEDVFSLKDIFDGLLKYLFKEVIANAGLLTKIIVLAVICAFLSNLSNAFESDSVAKLAHAVCYLVIVAIAIQSFTIAISTGSRLISDMVTFMQALLPVLLTLLMAMGGLTATAIFQPIIFASLGFISSLMKDFVLPLIFFSSILSIVNHLSEKIQVSKLASLLKQIGVAAIGCLLTVFVGIITIQGVAASTTDGVTLRTAKFAVGFIPVVGGFVTDAVDAVLGCSLLLKNAIGGFGLFALALLVIIPLLKIATLILIYKVASAMIEPITDNRLVDCLNDLSNSLTMLFGTVLSVAIMFFMAITIIISAGNITVMMR